MPATVGSAAELKEQLLASALEAYRQEYKELSESWRSLEAKAQAGVAVAGIFIAGVLAPVSWRNAGQRSSRPRSLPGVEAMDSS